MSLRHAIYFSCDSCGAECSDQRDTEELARNRALNDGWMLSISGDDYCPECLRVRRENHRGVTVSELNRQRQERRRLAEEQAERELLGKAKDPASSVSLDASGTLKRLGILP